jgi:hypothetical protein
MVSFMTRRTKGCTQGPFTRAQLASFREHLTRIGRWRTLRVWRAGSERDGCTVPLASLFRADEEEG